MHIIDTEPSYKLSGITDPHWYKKSITSARIRLLLYLFLK